MNSLEDLEVVNPLPDPWARFNPQERLKEINAKRLKYIKQIVHNMANTDNLFLNDKTAIRDELKEIYSTWCIGNYRIVVNSCRSIIASIALDKGAPTGQNFSENLLYLFEQGYIPKVYLHDFDAIRETAGKKVHGVEKINELIACKHMYATFILIRLVYEFANILGTTYVEKI